MTQSQVKDGQAMIRSRTIRTGETRKISRIPRRIRLNLEAGQSMRKEIKVMTKWRKR